MEQTTGVKVRAFTVGWFVVVGAFVAASPAIFRAVATPAAPFADFADDATAIVAAFGPPDADFTRGTTGDDSGNETRYLVYRSRDVRIALVRRDRRHTGQAVWTVVGPADAAGRVALTGKEALRRLRLRR